MTTIAWDGHTLAADKQTTWGSTPTMATKITRVMSPDGWVLFGTSGSAYDGVLYRQWASGRLREKPTFTDLNMMMVMSDGSVWMANEQMIWMRVHVNQWAIGSGCDYAIGALRAGATAVEAVEIAIDLDINSGFGIDTLEF